MLFTDRTLFGITNYLFEGGLNSVGGFVTLQHIYILPLSVYAIYRIGLKSKMIWIASFLEMVVFYFLSLFFTDPLRNTNCVFESCINIAVFVGD